MTRVLGWREHVIEGSRSVLGFETWGSRHDPVWDRYLTVRGEPIFYLGNICGTCRFLFEQVDPISRGRSDNITSQDLVDALGSGLTSVEPGFLNAISPIIPDGEYIVALLQTQPRLVTPGSDEDYFAHENVDQWGFVQPGNVPHHTKTEYYRGVDQVLSSQALFFEFIVPLYPRQRLNEQRVSEFRAALSDGSAPTAVALSILDFKQAYDQEHGHWCLTHYLVDGHHKVMAANVERKPITVLAFIAVKYGNTAKEEIELVLRDITGL